jgi:hypothetical protein
MGDNRRLMHAAALPVLLALLVAPACGFRSPSAGEPEPEPEPDTSVDAAVDAPAAAPPLCAPDPNLLVCFSFDADPLPASLPNEGSASLAATLANVSRIARGTGGAALLGTTCQMRIAPNATTVGVVAVEAWVRIDADPPSGGRIGILDSEATSAAVDVFYYYGSTSRQIQFQIGQTLVLDVALSLGNWHYLAQVCAGSTLTAYVDGVKVGERTGCVPGIAGTYGLQIGQNNTGSSTGDSWLVGAFDGLRIWTTPLSAAAICRTSGRTDC